MTSTGASTRALEQINAGTTTVVDTSQCTETPEHTDAAVEGLMAAGVRSVYAFSPKAHGSKPHPSYAHPADITRLRDTYFASDDQLVTLAMGSPVDETIWRLARHLGIPIFSHVNQDAAGLQLEKLSKLGLAGPWNTYIHCTGLAPSISVTKSCQRGACPDLGACGIELRPHGRPRPKPLLCR